MRWIRWMVVPAAAVLIVWLFPAPFLRPAANYLVDWSPPVKSDCLFVLAGDSYGQRITMAGDLYRQGLAPKVFVSGPKGIYGHTEDELAIAFARKAGYADVPFAGLPNEGRSTVSEARLVLPELRNAGCKSVLVVTSDYHSRRAKRILSREWPDLTVHLAASPSVDFDASRWWTERSYQKTLFFEWSKTVADWIGL